VLQSALRLLRARPAEGAGLDSALDSDMLTELVASLADERHGQADVAWLRRVKRTLDDPSETPPSVATLAADAAVHPVYLARRFRAAFGMSVREYRQIVQVRRAIQLVVGSRRSLSDIAHGCGFADHSHMCRAFRSVAHTTPGSLRIA
jgi:AraC family transcriptional regulator